MFALLVIPSSSSLLFFSDLSSSSSIPVFNLAPGCVDKCWYFTDHSFTSGIRAGARIKVKIMGRDYCDVVSIS